jgi:hypothetical protein
MNEFIQLLQTSGLSPDKVGKLISTVKIIDVKNQSILIKPDTISDKMYFVLKGGFVCRFIDIELEIERTINFYLEDFHPFMGCVDGYFSGTKTMCEMRAIAPSEVLEFNKKDIDDLICQDIELLTFYNSLITKALQEENDFKLKIISYSSERLYSYLIEHCPKVIELVPSRFVAEFMGISSEWLSKLKHRI